MLVNHSKQRALSGTVYTNDRHSGITLTAGAIAGTDVHRSEFEYPTLLDKVLWAVNYRKRCQDPHSVAHVH